MSRNFDYAKIARHPSQSVAPELWPSHAWVPAFGPTGATLFDLCASNNGTIANGTWVPGGISFAGTGGIDCGGIGNPTAITVVARGLVPAVGETLFAKWNTTASQRSFAIYRDASALRCATTETGAFSVSFDAPTTSYPTKITSFALTGGDGLYVKQYHDGLLKATSSSAPSSMYDSTQSFKIARFTSDNYYYTGSIESVLMYYRVLSSSELLSLATDPLLPFRRRLPVFYSVPSAGGTFEGTFSASIGAMTLSSSGKIGVGGSVQATAGATTMAQTGQEGKQGRLDATFTAMLLEALGALGVSGVLSADSGAISGSLAGQEGKQGIISASVSSDAAIAGQEGKQGTLDTSISLSALLYGSFSDGTQDVFEGTISAAAGIVSADIAGNAGISGAFVSQVVIAAALAGAVGVVGDATLSLDSLAASLAGQIGVSGQVSISVSAGAEIAGKIGVAGEIVAALADLELRLVEIVISEKIYRIVLSTKSGRCVLTTKSGSVTWH